MAPRSSAPPLLRYDLTVAQAAEYLQRPVGWVYKAAQRRELAHTKVGRELRFSTVDLGRYMAARRREAVSA